jgi:ADP-ribose pyrophosphatase
MPETWPLVSSRLLHELRIFRLRIDRLLSPRTGGEYEFVVVDASDWVNVVPITTDGNVVMIRQFRAGTGRVTLEIPGGCLDGAESAREGAERELLEETGYGGGDWTSLGSIEPNPAFLNNRCHTLLVEGVRKLAEPAQEEREDIETIEVPLREIPALIASGAISHCLVAVAFQKLDLHRSGVRFP